MSQESFSVLQSPSIHNDQNKVHKTQSSMASGHPMSILNPRSCVTCRNRKVKCDRKKRCTNCVKANIECIYPSPGRAPRKPRKVPDSDLMDRLRKLEGVVQMLGTQTEEGAPTTENIRPEEPAAELSQDEKIANAVKELKQLRKQKWEADKESKPPPQTGLEKRFGRLVVDEGNMRSRYINPSFWASLSDEVENIKEMLNDSDEEDERSYPSPETNHSSNNHQGFVFGLSSQNVDMHELHPPPDHLPIYWKRFVENVDPLVKIIHAPTIEPTILRTAENLETVPRGLECLLFAIYYGAVTSMWDDECQRDFDEEKPVLLARYRFGVEQALARADFLQTDEVVVLQAFVIFLICLRRNDDARVIWTLTGLVVRMAQTLGLHRDGSHYGLSPFQIEMRRRLWWQICILDSRASEDHGADPTITDQFDTQMPLNVNDEDLDPTMGSLPQSKTGCTQMTFGLIRFEISITLRKLQYVPPGPRRCNKFFSDLSVEKKEQWVKDLHDRLESQYLRDTDMSIPLYWVVATISRLIMSKLWLIIYHPFQRQDGGSSLPQEVRDKLFSTSLENCEYSILLETDEKTQRWGWLFRTYTQWHAIAFMLSELTTRVKGPEVERAWKAIDHTISRRYHSDQSSNKLKSHLWKPLRKLMERARKAYDEAQKEERLQVQARGKTLSELEQSGSVMNMDLSVDRLFPDLIEENQAFSLGRSGPQESTSSIGNAVGYPMFQTNHPSATLFDYLPNLEPHPNAFVPQAGPSTMNSGTQVGLPQMSDQWLGDIDPIPDFTSASGTSALDVSQASINSPLLPDGSVNWPTWDSMVSQYGMDAENNEVNQGQPFPLGSTFSGLTQWY